MMIKILFFASLIFGVVSQSRAQGDRNTGHKEPGNNSLCSHCGKNSCDMDCSSNPKNVTAMADPSNLKEMIPSCSLSESQLHQRKELLQSTIATKVARVEEMETGYDLIFKEPKEFAMELLEFINFERSCCSSFTFALIFEPHEKATHLQIYGSKGIKQELATGFRELGLIR